MLLTKQSIPCHLGLQTDYKLRYLATRWRGRLSYSRLSIHYVIMTFAIAVLISKCKPTKFPKPTIFFFSRYLYLYQSPTHSQQSYWMCQTLQSFSKILVNSLGVQFSCFICSTGKKASCEKNVWDVWIII